MPEDRPRRTSHEKDGRKPSAAGWQLIAVQSVSCLVVILIALVFRLIGGSAFAELRKSFNDSIMSNSVIATLSALFQAPSDEPSASEDSSSGTTPTTGAIVTDPTTGPTNSGETTAPTAESTTPAVGGQDLPVTQKKVFYAPQGATFAPLSLNRAAAKPLEKGTITSWFGYRENPTKGGTSFHQALDIGTEDGAPIAAMYFGVVSEIGENDSYGKYVKLFHGNGIEVLYAHCSEILVLKDAVIRAGETVAQVGSTGDSTGPHLHIEIRVNGVAYDPAGVVPVEAYA